MSDSRSYTTALTRGTVWFMAISVGAIVANGYYAQPILPQIARDFGIDVTRVGIVTMLTQVGTALGMLLFVPLGDTVERRSLIIKLLLLCVVALGATAVASHYLFLAAAGFFVGLFTATVHLIVPFAATLAPEKERGKVVGMVLSGLLLGILLARTFSGFVAAELGWRQVYWIAAGLMLTTAIATRLILPRSEPEVSLSYRALLRSMVELTREHRALRESSLVGAALFCSFSAFWTTLAFLLEGEPFHYGSAVAGLFGLAGAAGAAGAPWVGKLTDNYGTRGAIILSLVVSSLSFLILGLSARSLGGLIVGVLLMDLGVQAGHVANLSRIYAITASARSRLNTVYMVIYFIGGSLGSVIGAYCWRVAQWWGVCGFALAVQLATLIYCRGSKLRRSA